MSAALPVEFSPRRIAILRALNLGDMICATPAFRALREQFIDAEITLIGLPWAAELVPRMPWIDRFLEFPGFKGLPERPYDQERTKRFLDLARKKKFDLVVQMHGSGEISNSFAAALGGGFGLGYGPLGDDRLDLVLPWDAMQHEVIRWLELTRAIGCELTDPSVSLRLLPEDRIEADRLLAGLPSESAPVVGLHPGASDATKRWPLDRFASVANSLIDLYGARIVLTGSTDERHLGQKIQLLLSKPALDIVGQTSVGAFSGVIARLDLLLCNDTGASHVAGSTGTRSVVLFGQTEPARWAPLDWRLHTAIDAAEFVGGDRSTALARLPVEPVFAACISQLIAQEKKHAHRSPHSLVVT
jgi:ADP-heptose:LPS heptosyltransferase